MECGAAAAVKKSATGSDLGDNERQVEDPP